MKEVEFGQEKLSIKQDIENCKKRKNNTFFKTPKLYINSLLMTIAVLATGLGTLNYVDILTLNNILLIVTSALTTGIGYLTLETLFVTIKNKKITNNKNKSLVNLENLTEQLSELNIKTNPNEIINSVIIEDLYKKTEEKRNDTEESVTIKENFETVYLFLDENSNNCGLLEVENTTTFNDEEPVTLTDYYILEDEDLKEYNDKVVKVRKLIKTPR